MRLSLHHGSLAMAMLYCTVLSRQNCHLGGLPSRRPRVEVTLALAPILWSAYPPPCFLCVALSQVYNNNGNGIMLHRSCDRAKVFDNYSYDNEDAGLALYESSECQVYDNKFYFNRRESNPCGPRTTATSAFVSDNDPGYGRGVPFWAF